MSDVLPTTFTIPIPPPFTSEQPIHDNISLAFSCTQNPRNLEVPWYASHRETLSQLVKFPARLGTLSVLQQHPISISSQELLEISHEEIASEFPDGLSDDEVVEDEDSGNVPDRSKSKAPRRSARAVVVNARAGPSTGVRARAGGNVKAKANVAALRKQLKEYEDFMKTAPPPQSDDDPSFTLDAASDASNAPPEAAGDISFQSSSGATAADKGANDHYPDLMLNHCITATIRKPVDPQALSSWKGRSCLKVQHRCHPAIMEGKRGPSRCARGETLTRAVENLLVRATDDLLVYSSVYFKSNKRASAVIGITSAGGYWRWAMIKRADVPSYDHIRGKAWLEGDDKEALRDHQERFHELFSGHPWYYIGEAESDAEWTRLRDEGLIPLLEAHATDYPEVMQWVQADKGKGKMRQFKVGKSGSPSQGMVAGRSRSPKGRTLRSAGKSTAK